MLRSALILVVLAQFPALAEAQSCAAQSIRWETDGVEHRTVVEPRTRNGCPVLSQTLSRSGVRLDEATGVDCDCDLRIDGEETRFRAPKALVAGRMIRVCQANKASATPPDVYEREVPS